MCTRFAVLLLLIQPVHNPPKLAAQDGTAKITGPVEPKVSAAGRRPYYVAVAFHDVVDQRGDTSDEALVASNLVFFFEWLRANHWNAITLDDIERARSGARPLPEHAVLITFDDGYRSLYTRVYPLLLIYKIPVVAALVGSWMEGTNRETRRIGDNVVPGTDALISWDQAREMSKSGLVEFASHSYNLHVSELGDPQGSQMPSATTHVFDAVRGYEKEDAYRKRIRADLERSRALMQRELGRAPRAIVWPFGRYTLSAREEALAAGYEFLVNMDPEPGFPEDLPQVPRLLPVRDPDLPTMVTKIVPDPPTAERLVRLDPAVLSPEDPAAFEKNLGLAIERVRLLGATTVVVEAVNRTPEDNLEAAWFPTSLLPVKADVLSRIVWQIRTRARVRVVLSLPVNAARAKLASDAEVLQLFEDLAVSSPGDALLLADAPGLAAIPLDPSLSTSPWETRKRRNALDLSRLSPADSLALQAFFSFERVHPEDSLILLTRSVGSTPSAIADLTLVEAAADEKPFREVVEKLVTNHWLALDRRYNCGVWIRSPSAPSSDALAKDVRLFQRRGGVAFGWEQDNPVKDEPKATEVAPSVSAARFPVRF